MMTTLQLVFVHTWSFAIQIPQAEPPPPSAEFVVGFEAGVRYGLVAKSRHPQEDDIPTLIDRAKFYYWLIVVKKGQP